MKKLVVPSFSTLQNLKTVLSAEEHEPFLEAIARIKSEALEDFELNFDDEASSAPLSTLLVTSGGASGGATA